MGWRNLDQNCDDTDKLAQIELNQAQQLRNLLFAKVGIVIDVSVWLIEAMKIKF